MPIKEVRIDKDKFSVIGKIESKYNIVENYYIYLYSENEQLLELSKIHDSDAKEFIENLFLEVIALFEKESDEAYEKARVEEHNKAVELINKLKWTRGRDDMKENKYDKGTLVFKRNKDIWSSGLLSVSIITYNSNFKEPAYQFMAEYNGKLLVEESNEMKDICTQRGVGKLKEIKTQIEAIIAEIEAGGLHVE